MTFAGKLADTPHPHIIPTYYVEWQEHYEFLLYATALPLGVACGCAAMYRSVKPSWLLVVALTAFIPAFSLLCRALFGTGRVNPIWAAVCALTFLPLLLSRSTELPGERKPSAVKWVRDSARSRLVPEVISFCGYLVLVLLSLTPSSFADLATTLTDPHVGSYLIVPALGYLSPVAVPGVDFESHYGLGLPFLFSWFLGNSFEETSYRAAIFLWSLTIAFYASLYLMARTMVEEIWLSFAVSILVLASGFDGFSFSLPSDLPVRFLFAPVFFWSCVRAAHARRPWTSAAATGIIAGMAVFWQTDTGIFVVLSGGALFFALLIIAHLGWRPFVAFSISAAATFAIGLLAVAGPSQISFNLLDRLLEPILLYSGGFGGVRLTWRPGWSYFYNVVSPAVLAGSIAYSIVRLRRSGPLLPDSMEHRRYLYLFLLSFFAYLSLMKWVNRSLDTLWWLNGWPVLLVLTLWGRLVAQRFAKRSPARPLQEALAGPLLFAAVAALSLLNFRQEASPGLSRAPAERWFLYFKQHPSILSDAYFTARGMERDPNSRRQVRPIDRQNSDFVRRRTQPGDRVVILSKSDWLYLEDARRASGLHWLPLYLTHSDVLLSRNLQDLRSATHVFLEKRLSGESGYWGKARITDYPAYAPVDRLIRNCFQSQETNSAWILLVNRCEKAAVH
jgi:hypothetical protein